MMACRQASTLESCGLLVMNKGAKLPPSGHEHTPVTSTMHCRDHLLQQVVGGLVLVAEVPPVLLDIHDLALVLLAALCASLRGKMTGCLSCSRPQHALAWQKHCST